MAKYEKWLGAGLGWALTGNPLGGLLGFLTGHLVGQDAKENGNVTQGISEFEMNLVVLASRLIKIDGEVELEEINFTKNFLDTHFDEKYSAQRVNIINHCLQKEYDLGKACDLLRMYATPGTRTQVIRFLFDLAQSDGELNERENYFIFKIAGYLNVNDVEFRKIRGEQTTTTLSVYELFGVTNEAPFAEIRNRYRKLVLKYHPDKNAHLTEKEKKELAHKFVQIQEAYDRIKEARGEK